MPEYKLTYFDGRGVLEPIRWIFAYAGVPFEDVRIPFGGLTPEKKIELGLQWGQVPILEIDGKQFAQSGAIGRYLAREYNLMGKDKFEALKVDEIMEAVMDYVKLWSQWTTAPDDKKAEIKTKILEVDTPLHWGRFNKCLEQNGGKWFVGNSVTYADFIISHYATHGKSFDADIHVENYPALAQLVTNVENLKGIKEWIQNRPITQF